MRIHFSKMHGLGNDFVVIDLIHQTLNLSQDHIRALAQRRYGIGCDQVLVVEKPRSAHTAFRYRIYNADGNEVEQCGNGARCVARFVYDKGLVDTTQMTVETAAGDIILEIEADGRVTVNMGSPILRPADIPFQAEAYAPTYALSIDQEQIEICALSMGNPHAVLQVKNVDTAAVSKLGPIIESHSRFPKRVNVGFMQIINRQAIRLRVYERGVGETLACGTGACAAVVAGRIQELLDERVRVHLPGGELMITWPGNASPVMMTGSATHVFEGDMML